MIIGSLEDTQRIEMWYPRFKKVFDYLKSVDLLARPAGKIVLEEGEIWVNVDEVAGKSRETAKLEAHNKYIDIQFPLLKNETFGWQARERAQEKIEKEYNEKDDIVFYGDTPSFFFTLPVGDFVVFFPEDAHAPCIGEGIMKKAVVKVKLP